MYGLMQREPINLVSILGHAARWHPHQEVVTNTVEGGIHRQSYSDTYVRATRLANRLQRYGIEKGDRVGTLGWNTYRHLESWYAIAGIGAVCHTVNPRLFPEQIKLIVNHAQDRLLVVDLTFADLIREALPDLPSVEAVIFMCRGDDMPDVGGWARPVYCYERWVGEGEDRIEWPALAHDAASSLCYTSGTTGDPKGVLYSHRGNLLHAYALSMPDVLGIAANETLLMVVPMFHANSWGLAYAGPMAGAKLVLPGPHMDGKSIAELINGENVTKAAAVPTVWTMLLGHLRTGETGLDSLKEVGIGGSAVPRAMIEEFRNDYGVNVVHIWGMTEMTPLGTVSRPKPSMAGLGDEQLLLAKCKQGRVPFGVDMKIVDDAGRALPHDGRTFGRLLVKGPWTIERYYRSDESALTDGWFDTGDIATIDEHGFMQVTDRSKDVIKSGGEWISSVAIENAVMGLEGVEIAACIGAKHPKWDERPIVLVKRGADSQISKNEIIGELSAHLAKWQLPDAIVFVDAIPLTATGKIDKKPLRAAYGNCLLQ
ncbi:MAG: long-chain fatty acid--CoA ligase [Proteobacteria bacterium]|nr:long-chain fatty acid--CoA ligase [Pseudomonadota bacterium]